MTRSELKTIRDFADKKIVKTSNGKYYNYGYTANECMYPSTRYKLQKYGQSGTSYEKILLRIFDVLDLHPEVKVMITEYDGDKDMKVKE
jgi:hypothetical protein